MVKTALFRAGMMAARGLHGLSRPLMPRVPSNTLHVWWCYLGDFAYRGKVDWVRR